MLGAAVETEAWTVLANSLERVIEESEEGSELRGMHTRAARERHLLTLLPMPMLGLFKPYALNAYSGTALGLLTGRGRPYSADEMDHFILSCVRAGWTEPLTADAAGWATQLWAAENEQSTDEGCPEPVEGPTYLYWDWHVKAVYSDYHVPRTKHGTMLRILGARKQLMLHDSAGHLLFMDTYRGDTHLIDGMIDGTTYYEGLERSRRLTHQIFDREGLSVAHFKDLLDDEGGKRLFTTSLRSNQYEGVESFESLTPFVPFRRNKDGKVTEEIAEAVYEMRDRRAKADDLPLRAILLRKAEDSAEDGDDDDEVRLQVIVTADQDATAAEVAERYRARQSKQENAIRDWWLPLGGDVNIGYAKEEVENSELAKVKADLEGRLERLERYIPACEERLERAKQRHQKHRERYQVEVEEAERAIEKEIRQRDARSESALDIHRRAEAERERTEEELKPVYAQVESAAEKIKKEQEKREKYRQEREEKEQELAEVSQAMEDHPMYELDDRKDQLMGALRIFLVNILQWLRGEVFPETYERATYKTLAPFLQMGGFVVEHPDCIEVFLDGFWQSAKQRELEEIVARCNALKFTAPDGRRLWFAVCPKPGHI